MTHPPITIPNMGKKKQPADRHRHGVIGFRLEKALVDGLKSVAKKNARTLTAEISIALKKHLREEADKPGPGDD